MATTTGGSPSGRERRTATIPLSSSAGMTLTGTPRDRQIIVTGSTLSDVREAEDEDEEDYESFGNSTDFRYEFRNSAGKVIASISVRIPMSTTAAGSRRAWRRPVSGRTASSRNSLVIPATGHGTAHSTTSTTSRASRRGSMLPRGRYWGNPAVLQGGRLRAVGRRACRRRCVLLMAKAGGWKRIRRTFEDVPAVLARYPGLARLRPGRVTYFDLGGSRTQRQRLRSTARPVRGGRQRYPR